MGNFYKVRSLSIVEQDEGIKRKFPQFKRFVNYKKGMWVGSLNPTIWSPKYKIKIIYIMKSKPQVTVIKPELLYAKEKKHLPHVYPENVLCLFDPKKKEWNDRQFIAHTIIPWTSLWLFYYEDWLYTGNWLGGGRHPNKVQNKSKNTRIKI